MRRHGVVYACPHCGGRDLIPKLMFGGPLAGVDDNDGSCRCQSCGKMAVPLTFASMDDWISFRQSLLKKADEERSVPKFRHIPILPVDTKPLLSLGGVDIPFIKLAEVVSVRWVSGSLKRTEYHVSFERYWRAVAGQRYNASEVLLLDLAGVNEAKPNFRVMRELVKKKYDVWLDLGIRTDQDLFDAFSMEVARALADTSTCTSMRLFQELYELSDKCVPCLQWDGKVIWGRPRAGPADLIDAIKKLRSLGFDELAVVDMRHLGTRSGVSTELLALLEGMDVAMVVGGGVVERDLELIEKRGFSGAFIDPFTPLIEDLFEDEGSPVETRFTSPTPTIVKRPNYLATD